MLYHTGAQITSNAALSFLTTYPQGTWCTTTNSRSITLQYLDPHPCLLCLWHLMCSHQRGITSHGAASLVISLRLPRLGQADMLWPQSSLTTGIFDITVVPRIKNLTDHGLLWAICTQHCGHLYPCLTLSSPYSRLRCKRRALGCGYLREVLKTTQVHPFFSFHNQNRKGVRGPKSQHHFLGRPFSPCD